jgi:predicted transposase YbfD/YdcC
MAEILLVSLCAIIDGAEGWQEIEAFGEGRIDVLRKVFPFKHGIPSEAAVRILYRALNAQTLPTLLRAWLQDLQLAMEKGVAPSMLPTVSVYATEARVVLVQEKASGDSNPSTTIPALLPWLDLEGTLVTVAGLGCDQALAEQILAHGADVIFALKDTDAHLYEEINRVLQYRALLPSDDDFNKEGGRSELRTCWVSDHMARLHQRYPQWASLESIIRIDAKRQVRQQKTAETRCYLSSKPLEPASVVGHQKSLGH